MFQRWARPSGRGPRRGRGAAGPPALRENGLRVSEWDRFRRAMWRAPTGQADGIEWRPDVTIRVAIVDDEPLAIERMRRLLAGEPDIQVVAECGNGAEAVAAIRSQAPDLVFLDVQRPGLDGFGVVEQVGPQAMPATIFATAFDEHALQAFDTQCPGLPSEAIRSRPVLHARSIGRGASCASRTVRSSKPGLRPCWGG